MDNLRSLNGKTVLVTGATSGIGFYTALGLARMGAVVYITGRDLHRGIEAERRIRAAGQVRFIQADASTVGGNQKLAQILLTDTDRLHILVNNVGGVYEKRRETTDGYEATLAMNLVGPFALTEALLPLMQQSAPARIVNVTSAGYQMWKGDLFEDVQYCENYLGFHAYNRSKYLNLLWTLALARRLEGSGIVTNALHPGTAWTAMTRDNRMDILPSNMRLLWPLIRLMQRTGSPEKVARTSVFLASAPEAAQMTGQYFESSTRPKNLGPTVVDETKQERTWELAASLVREAATANPCGTALAIQSMTTLFN